MGKCIAYTAASITLIGIGVLATALTIYFVNPDVLKPKAFVDEMPRYALCNLRGEGNSDSVSGLIMFNQTSMGQEVIINGLVSGLTDGPHGFHIHQYGVTDGDCKSTGSHFNPDNNPHGGPESDFRHVGDLGNIVSNSSQATVDIEDKLVTLYGDTSVVGRAIVIHAGEDDLGESGDAAGAAGSRVACCNIYLSSGEI